MKTTITIILTAAAVLAFNYFLGTPDYATSQQLESVRAEIELKFDSVYTRFNISDVKLHAIDSLSRSTAQNIDTLKSGQQLIFQEISKDNQDNFKLKLMKLLY